ncbi:hypothetical protein QJS10_CPB20g00469 [Acorus calamus]|uniref:Neprosin PEP catalytic domain-containing protein n=1 Tax=Acorus calamus TaxID=4465 RepID=A0AAV9CEF7_ACOCL|nr:hypothetical protein QJS10_CPB20g00469 [Acorus calamus]
MGNGPFPSEGERKASVFTNIQVLDAAQKGYISPNQVKYLAERPRCYDVTVKRSSNWGLYSSMEDLGGTKTALEMEAMNS